MTRLSRPISRIALPTTSSEWPSPYTSAVSIRFTPHSWARTIAATQSRLFTSVPQFFPPACHIPRPIAETLIPVRPSSIPSIGPAEHGRSDKGSFVVGGGKQSDSPQPTHFDAETSRKSGGRLGRRKRMNGFAHFSWYVSDASTPARTAP